MHDANSCSERQVLGSPSRSAWLSGIGAMIFAELLGVFLLIFPPLGILVMIAGLFVPFAGWRTANCPNCGNLNLLNRWHGKACTDCKHRLALRGMWMVDLSAGGPGFANSPFRPANGSITVPSYDRQKWATLLRYNDRVAAAAAEVRPLGQKWVHELAAAHLALNDEDLLPTLVFKIVNRAHQEKDARSTRAK